VKQYTAKKPAKKKNKLLEEQKNFCEQNQFFPTALHSHYQVATLETEILLIHPPLSPHSPLLYFVILQSPGEEKLFKE
jgi:hypothetical protein